MENPPMMTSPLPLNDFLVIDLTAHRAGPTAVRQLADWGAQVIKIEPSGELVDATGSRREGPDFQNLHRNKRAMTLNLKSNEGRAIFFKLAERADVIVENYKSDVKHRLGIDYEAVRKINPRIVYGSISGFGQDGPYAGRAGVDQIAQGMGRCASASQSTTPRRDCCCPMGSYWHCSTASAAARGNGSTPRCSRRKSSCSISRRRVI